MPGVDTYNKIISTVNSVTTDYQFIPDISNIITIDTSNNRIGIGTLNPETSLHIKGSNNLGIITTNLEISSNPYDLNSGFVKSSLIPYNFDYSDPTFTQPTNDNSKNQFTLGDPSNPWYSVYCISGNFQEINLGGNTLYIDGKAVLGKEGNNIKFGYEEENYDIKMSSKFTDISINGNLNFISYNNIPRIITSQSDIIIDPSGIGDNSGKVTIKGDLIVFGNQTALSSQELDISDNIITLNKGYDQALNGTNITSGFYIDKGQSYTNASLLYYIDQDNWKLSGSGGLKIPSGNNNERYHISDPGTIRYNSELTSFEGYNGTAWGTLGGVISVDKRTKIIPELFPDASNNQLDFYTDNNHIMRLDESGNMLPMHINQNIGNNTKAWKNIYIGDPNGIDYNLNDNSSNAIYLNNIKILYFDNNKNLVFNNPNSNIKIPFNLSVDGTAGIASTANNNTNIAGGFVYNTKIGIDQNGINGLEQSYFSQTQTYELTVLDSINFHDSLTNNYNYSLKDANFNNLEISNNLIVNGVASFNNNLEISNNLIVNGDASFNNNLDISNNLNIGNNLNVNQEIRCDSITALNTFTQDYFIVYDNVNSNTTSKTWWYYSPSHFRALHHLSVSSWGYGERSCFIGPAGGGLAGCSAGNCYISVRNRSDTGNSGTNGSQNDGFTGSHPYAHVSDDRIKHNEKIIENGLNNIRQLVPKKYKKTPGKILPANFNGDLEDGTWFYESGLIAQEILKIEDLSWCVRGGDYIDNSGNNIEELYNVCYNNILMYHIAATKELDTIVQNQENEINNLKIENNDLKNENNLIKSKLNEILLEMGKETI